MKLEYGGDLLLGKKERLVYTSLMDGFQQMFGIGHRDGVSGVAHIFGLAFSFVLFSVSPFLVLVPLSAENSTYLCPSVVNLSHHFLF